MSPTSVTDLHESNVHSVEQRDDVQSDLELREREAELGVVLLWMDRSMGCRSGGGATSSA